MEDNKRDNVESLAAFLHSGEDDTPVQKTETPSPSKKAIPEKKITSTGSLSDVLFSGKNSSERPRETKRSAAPVAVEDLEPDEPYYEQAAETAVYSDNAATQMMDIGAAKYNSYMSGEPEKTDEEKEEQRALAAMKVRYEKQRLRSRTFAYILLGAFLSIVIIGVSAYISSYIVTFALDLTGIATTDFKIDVIIPEGADVKTVGAILQENNIIKSAKFFEAFADFTKKSEVFQSGTYTLSSTMSYMTIFDTLQSRSINYKTVTIRIVEGMTASEIGALLEENKVCYAEDFEQYYKNVQNKFDFERRVSEKSTKFNQLEGYLFPDTYEFYAVLDVPEIVYDNAEDEEEAARAQRKKELENAEEAAKKMYQNFDDKITKQMYKQIGEMGMTLDEVVTLASMVQKEAASTEDMYYVASVFLNRIHSPEDFPNLQSDVTVLYVENDIKPYVDAGTPRYTRYANAYNTYVCEGVPAGPICNPGLDAINAILNAAETDYYYFCANEETGEVYYAATHDEHEANLVLAGLA